MAEIGGAPASNATHHRPAGPPHSAAPDRSRSEVEWLLVLILLAVRVTVLIPAALAAPGALASATHPLRYALVSVATVLFVACLAATWLRRRRADSRAWGLADTAVCLVAIVLNASSFPAGMQIGTWAVWAPGYLVAVTLSSVAWGSARTTLGVAALFGGGYVATLSVTSPHQLSLSIYNAVGYLLLAAICSAATALLRRFATETDAAREQAAAAAAALENERYRAVVHDTTGLLRLLATDGLPTPTRDVLREQALAEAARLRAYVDEPRATAHGAPCTIGALVANVLTEFRDLPLEPALALGQHAQLTANAADTLERALRTVLYNVRHHARAEQVVVHADAREGTWTVTVSDDGVGFDPETQPLGFGLGTQLLEHATAVGISVELRAHPGAGTTVVLTGADASAVSAGSARLATAPSTERARA